VRLKKYLLKVIVKLASKNIIKISDKKYLYLLGQIRLNEKMNLDTPTTFSEKLQWLKIYDRNPRYTKMVDKYEAKKYVASKIGEQYIIPTIGVWDKFEYINFDELPNEFVVKCTHDSGGLVICRNKKELNYDIAKKKINKSLKRNYYNVNKEWPYKNVKPRIIVEKYMKDKKLEKLRDYKYYCFNGEPKYIYVSEGLEHHPTAKISFYDMNYEKAPFGRSDYKEFEEKPEKPLNFEKMKELARILSKDIPFLRVDFYEINEKIYFGELTFTPCTGMMPIKPKEYDKILGDMLELPKEKREEK